MKISTNLNLLQTQLTEPKVKKETIPDQVVIGGSPTDNTIMMAEQLKNLKAKEESKPDFNLINLENAKDITSKSDEVLKGKSFRIATAGYSAPPEGYEGATTRFLEELTNKLGTDKVGLVTSPTADKGSIDAISSTVAQKQGSPVLYVTAKDYVEYIKPENFPDTIDKAAYNTAPKYVFPTGSEYSKATAEASNSLLVTGGRDATVSDFVNALDKGNKVVILENKTLGGVEWNEKKNRPNNGAAYIKEQLEAFKSGNPLPYPDCKGFNKEFLDRNAGKLDDLVKVATISGDADIQAAAKVAAEHLSGKPDFNLINLENAKDIRAKSDEVFKEQPVRIATAGYSAPPEGYEGTTTRFLEELMNKIGTDKVGLVTSPTADKGSIDAISSTVAQKQGSPVLYITAKDYVEYINPNNFPDTIDKAAYNTEPKYVFPTGSEYSKATAEASNSLLVTGGRDATVSDFVNAVEKGNKVVILDNKSLGGVEWNEKKNRPNNGAAYIKEQLEAFKKGQPLPYPDCKGFSADFANKNASRLDNLVKVVTISGDADIQAGVKAAAEHFKPSFDISLTSI